jgi:hypothetical protein
MDAQLDLIKFTPTGHSSTVEMWLHVGAARFPVLQSSESAIKLNSSHKIPQGDALLEIIVDGRPRQWPIRVLDPTERPNWVGIVDR